MEKFEPTKQKLIKRILDPSAIVLLAANLYAAIIGLQNGWQLVDFIWLYWLQSVIIGLFNFFRILLLKNFSTEKFLLNNKPVRATPLVKIKTAFFFLVHYGIFMTGYALMFSGLGRINWEIIKPAVLILLANHLLSFIYNFIRERQSWPNLGTVMFLPYLRILPMHFPLWLGGLALVGAASVWPFILCKIAADYLGHLIEHSKLSQNQSSEPVLQCAVR